MARTRAACSTLRCICPRTWTYRPGASRAMPSPRPAKPLLDFGAIPLTVSPMADVMLLKLPRKNLRHVSDGLRQWASKAPISAAKALYYIDTEDPDLRYVLLQFLLVPPRTFDIDDQVEYEELIAEELARVYT